MSEPHPVLLYYHEIDPAGLPAEGGGHELRIVPAAAFRPILEKMLHHMGPEWNVTQGVVNWTNPDGHAENAIIELWPPAQPDQDELRLRIPRMYEVGGWRCDAGEFAAARDAGQRWFYVLEMDSDDSLIARILRQPDLEGEDPEAAAHLRRLLDQSSPDRPLRASVDLLQHEAVP